MAFCAESASVRDTLGITRQVIVISQTTTIDNCPDNQIIIVTNAEYRQLSNNPFSLSLSDGVSLSTAIISILALGFVYRVIIKMLTGLAGEDNSNV